MILTTDEQKERATLQTLWASDRAAKEQIRRCLDLGTKSSEFYQPTKIEAESIETNILKALCKNVRESMNAFEASTIRKMAAEAEIKISTNNDSERLEWLLSRLSGSELRRIGIIVSEGGLYCGRIAIDAAMKTYLVDNK